MFLLTAPLQYSTMETTTFADETTMPAISNLTYDIPGLHKSVVILNFKMVCFYYFYIFQSPLIMFLCKRSFFQRNDKDMYWYNLIIEKEIEIFYLFLKIPIWPPAAILNLLFELGFYSKSF